MGAIIPLIILALEQAIKHAPALAIEISALLGKKTVTSADWLALRMRYVGKSYEDYVPDSGLIPTPPPQP